MAIFNQWYCSAVILVGYEDHRYYALIFGEIVVSMAILCVFMPICIEFCMTFRIFPKHFLNSPIYAVTFQTNYHKLAYKNHLTRISPAVTLFAYVNTRQKGIIKLSNCQSELYHYVHKCNRLMRLLVFNSR